MFMCDQVSTLLIKLPFLTSNCNLTHSHSREYICLRMKHDAQKEKCKMLLTIAPSNQPPLATELPNIKNVFSVFYSCSFHISFRIQFSHFDNLLFFPFFSSIRFYKKKALTAARDWAKEMETY
jgi:hypothetical protein